MTDHATSPDSPAALGERLLEISGHMMSRLGRGDDGLLTAYGLAMEAQLNDTIDLILESDAVTPADALALACFAHVTAIATDIDPAGYPASLGKQVTQKLIDYLERHSGEKASRFMVTPAMLRTIN